MIGYSDIPFFGTALSAPTLGTDYRAADAHGGARNRTVRLAAAATSSAWEWETAGATAVLPQYLFISRADLIQKKDSAPTGWMVEGSDDPFFSTPDVDDGVFDLGNLAGPRAEDFIVPVTKASAHAYWRVSLTTTASFKHELSKIFLGSWLDLDREPIYPAEMTRGSRVAMPRAIPWRFTLDWVGITDAKIGELTEKVLKYRDVNPVILYDSNDLVFPSAFKVLHAYITGVDVVPQWFNANNLRLEFEETI
jgi:hypothetical protein